MKIGKTNIDDRAQIEPMVCTVNSVSIGATGRGPGVVVITRVKCRTPIAAVGQEDLP
jgi:hypothetical protein